MSDSYDKGREAWLSSLEELGFSREAQEERWASDEAEGRTLSFTNDGNWHGSIDHNWCFKALLTDKEVGYLKGVIDWLGHSCIQKMEASDPERAATIVECREWVKKTKEYERINGSFTAINQKHPAWPMIKRAHFRALFPETAITA